jgi:hypothetical protein
VASLALGKEQPAEGACKKRAMKPANGDKIDVGGRFRALILRKLLTAKCGPENNQDVFLRLPKLPN